MTVSPQREAREVTVRMRDRSLSIAGRDDEAYAQEKPIR
jgi:hypothetical protein